MTVNASESGHEGRIVKSRSTIVDEDRKNRNKFLTSTGTFRQLKNQLLTSPADGHEE